VSAYIDEHRGRYGVEPICSVLQFGPRTYYAIKTRQPSARAVRDAELRPLIARVHRDNFGVYGVDKVWAQLNREGVRVARCSVARLMRELGLRGVVRGKPKFTTVAADAADRPRDLVDRRFSARRPEPALGRRPDLRPHLDRLRLRRVHHRRLLAYDRRLASLQVASLRSRTRRAGAGDLGPVRARVARPNTKTATTVKRTQARGAETQTKQPA
jgi:hypothetical protein